MTSILITIIAVHGVALIPTIRLGTLAMFDRMVHRSPSAPRSTMRPAMRRRPNYMVLFMAASVAGAGCLQLAGAVRLDLIFAIYAMGVMYAIIAGFIKIDYMELASERVLTKPAKGSV